MIVFETFDKADAKKMQTAKAKLKLTWRQVILKGLGLWKK